ncbi:hypothetical protein [Cephaloticoccus primus]|uniref:hypothetical protein n=1 Tax=Cephaloticoccus primus TaxID=1548207 RepID=UPI0012E8985E|nr:hypothetical protein [Cephaloticoccus primus]
MKINKITVGYILIGLTFFSYVLLRAIRVGVTYDEVVTLQEFVPHSIYNILFEARPIANNHILNTILIKAVFLFGAQSLFFARVPNLISFLLYLYFSCRILSRGLPGFYGIGCFVLLICNPFMLEFFSLARGYGLSLAFMMGALCFASDNIRRFSTSSLCKSLALGALSVVSIFSMIYFEIALIVVLNITIFLRRDWSIFRRSLIYSSLIGAALLAAISVPIFRLEKYNGLAYGGSRGFYSDTLLSLTRYTLGNFEASYFAPYLLNSFLCISIAVVGISFSRKWRTSLSWLFVGVAGLSVLLIICAHSLAGVKYPIDRVSLFLYPLMMLSLCFCLCGLGRWIGTGLLAVLVLALSSNFTLRANFYKTTLWDFDSHASQILELINGMGRAEGRVIGLRIVNILGRSVSYYANKNRYGFVRILDKHDAVEEIKEGYYFLYFSRNVFPDSDFVRHDKDRLPKGLSEGDIFIEYPEEQIIVFKDLKGGLPDY